jgi:hypothetical protein
MKQEDEKAIAISYAFLSQHTLATIPLPSADKFEDAKATLAEKDPKVAAYDLNRMIDPSFAQSAADRGLDRA